MFMRTLVLFVASVVGTQLMPLSHAPFQIVPVVSQPTSSTIVTPTLIAGFLYRPLLNLSPAELAQYALAFTLTGREIRVVSGTPEVLLARSILARELAPLGLTGLRHPDNDPLLVLAILRGDFAWIPPDWYAQDVRLPQQYVSSVFNASTGAPIEIRGSPDGALFRYALNDPSGSRRK